jgi:hypothetical protein
MPGSVLLNKLIALPHSPDHLPIHPVEHPLTIHLIIPKIPLKHLPITQIQLATAILIIIHKPTLIPDPKLINIIPRGIIIAAFKRLGILIVEHPSAPQPIVLPLAIIRDLIVEVVEDALAAHLIVEPFAGVLAALFVVEGAVAVPEVAAFLALVFAFAVGFGYVAEW